jgi:DNA end-binding protein Ku
MAARPLWSGSISFGLVSIPVRMFAATQSQELRFHFVDRRDLTPVGYDKVRKDTGEHVDPDATPTRCAARSHSTTISPGVRSR